MFKLELDRKATSNDPVIDNIITSGLKSFRRNVLMHCMPSSAPFLTTRKQTPLVAAVPRVSLTGG